MAESKTSLGKVLIFSLPGVGDSILFGPALKLLHQNFPDTEFHTLVMFKSVVDFFKRFPEIKTIHYWDFVHHSKMESIKYLLNLRKEKFDLVINAYPANRPEYNLTAKILGKKIYSRYISITKRVRLCC